MENNLHTINFGELDGTLSIPILYENVVIQLNPRTLEHDAKSSNLLTTTNVVQYSCENRYTLGRKVSYHPNKSLMAIDCSESNNYKIEIRDLKDSSRCVIKGFTGAITDIAFSRSQISYLAAIDFKGNVKVIKVNTNGEEIDYILNIEADAHIELGMSNNRVMWYSAKDTGTNKSLLLGVVHGSTVEILEIYTIENQLSDPKLTGLGSYDANISRVGLGRMLQNFQERCSPDRCLSDVFLPYLVHTAPNSIITSLEINSDATALAVAYRDGKVRFFHFNSKSTSGLNFDRCLTPFNDGKAVGSILFLDDCRADRNIDPSWCHVVVGAAFNSEIKLFRCDTWDCLQTVSFEYFRTPCLLSAHQSARCLIMSDIYGSALYVLELDSMKNNNEIIIFKKVQRLTLTEPISEFKCYNITNSTDSPEKEQTEEEDNTTGLEHDLSTVYLNESGTINSATDISEEEGTEKEETEEEGTEKEETEEEGTEKEETEEEGTEKEGTDNDDEFNILLPPCYKIGPA